MHQLTQFIKLTITRLISALAFVIGVAAQAEVPVVQAPDVIEVEFGKSFEYVITATNDPVGFFASDLPVWVKRKGATLYGNAVHPGDHTVTIRALNRTGYSVPHSLKISVMPREDSTD